MMAPGKTRSSLELVSEILWAAALVSLPVTSFPLFSSFTGALVAPLSILPMFLLLVLWVIPTLLRKSDLPKESTPLVVFTLAALVSCAAAYFIFIPGFKGKTVPAQEIRAVFTLAVGLTFFLVTTTWINDLEKLRKSLKYITLGGLLSLAWTSAQAFYILSQADQYPAWLDTVQSWFVVSSPSFSPRLGRVNGFTYEASWFAHQMVLLYLPLWLAASYYKTSAFKFRLWRFSLENILVLVGIVAFFISSPRIGLVSFFLLAVYFFIRLNIGVYRKLVDRFSVRSPAAGSRPPRFRQTSIRIASSLLLVTAYVIVIAAVFFAASLRDWRLSILISEPPALKDIVGLITLDQDTLLRLSHRFIFLERMVYWMNGWNIFTHYPWFGVGLGNAGFFFPDLAPSIGWATYEIRNVLYYLPQLPNVKSLWFRLLAETGLVGFSLFISWIYVLFKSSGFSQRHPDSSVKSLALAGQLALLAFIGEAFSIDSFAMPYFWIIAGMIASIGMIYRRQLKSTPALDDHHSDIPR